MAALTNASGLTFPRQGALEMGDLTDWLDERIDRTRDGLLFTNYRNPMERISAEERDNIGGAKLGCTKAGSQERGHDFPRHAHRSCTVTLPSFYVNI